MRKISVQFDKEVSYSIYGVITDSKNIQLTDEDRILSSITDKNVAIGYALGAFEYSDFTSIFVCEVTKNLNGWSQDDIETEEKIVWSCSSIQVTEETDENEFANDDNDFEDDEISEVTNEVISE